MQAYIGEKFSEAAIRQELSDPANIFHIIYHGEEPAGYSKIIFSSPHKDILQQEVTKLERLYILERFHGLKLGRELFLFNRNLSEGAGQAGMWLFVWTGNSRAIRFYEKAGFRIVGELGWFRLTDTHSNPNHQMLLTYGTYEVPPTS
jgi:ribosomal protein S18 acetylase RimI-like enzyme